MNINVDVGYFEHIKTKRLISKLGVGAESIPLKLWCAAAKFYPSDGIFKEMEAKEVLDLAGIVYKKHATSILDVCLKLKIIYKTPQGWYGVHEWKEYQGHIIAFKIRGEKAAKKRWEKLQTIEEEPLKGKELEEAWRMPSTQKTL